MISAVACLRFGLRFNLGIGTVFGPAEVDKWNPNSSLACRRGERVTEATEGVAHPSLPCGSEVGVCVVRTGRCVRARVVDRGPRRALVDLTMATARRLGWGERGGFSGRERVILLWSWR